jgi:hypothetical protein
MFGHINPHQLYRYEVCSFFLVALRLIFCLALGAIRDREDQDIPGSREEEGEEGPE